MECLGGGQHRFGLQVDYIHLTRRPSPSEYVTILIFDPCALDGVVAVGGPDLVDYGGDLGELGAGVSHGTALR